MPRFGLIGRGASDRRAILLGPADIDEDDEGALREAPGRSCGQGGDPRELSPARWDVRRVKKRARADRGGKTTTPASRSPTCGHVAWDKLARPPFGAGQQPPPPPQGAM